MIASFHIPPELLVAVAGLIGLIAFLRKREQWSFFLAVIALYLAAAIAIVNHFGLMDDRWTNIVMTFASVLVGIGARKYWDKFSTQKRER